ncbi:cytochrome C assembly protein, partial [Pseudodesulfovibrio sp.]|nr:cytochrome C assembly protein [Pseudodesulfovibrio sp.]
MGLFELLQIIIIALYGLGTVLFLTGVSTGNDRLKKLAVWLAVAGFTMNTVDLALVLSRDTAALNAGKFYFNILAWCVLALYFFL